MCIYGIKFTDGFDNRLYANDPDRNVDIARRLDEVGTNLCKFVSTVDNRNPYQQVVIQINNSYVDLFIICCKNCRKGSTEEEWRIHLKAQFLIHHYAVVEKFEERLSYEIATRKTEYSAPRICITEDYREIPVTGNNNVCFTYGEEKFTDTIAGKRYPSKFVNLLRMGQYNSSVLKYSLGRHCAMNYAQTAKLIEECTINLSEKGFQYFCCCYNDQLSQCQKRAATFLRRDNSTLGPLFCASQKLEVAKIKSGQQTGNWSFQMTLEEINNAIEKPDKSAYCHTHVTSDNVIQLGTGNSLCEGVDTLDARLRPIIRTFCFSAEDNDEICPFSPPETIKESDLVCCCNHQQFCNYKPHIVRKLVEENSTRWRCYYNDRYQYLFNEYYVRTSRNDVCLMHYIDEVTAKDMLEGFSEGTVFYSYPGNGFYPTDFAYTFLKNDTCTYAEVKISEALIEKSFGCFKDTFNTNNMPVKIFVCSCTLQEKGNHCDRTLEQEIASRAEQFPIESLTKCVKFNTTKAPMKRSDLIYVRHTSYCFTEVYTVPDKILGVKLRVRANVVTRLIAEEADKHFDHIAFSMYKFGSKTSFCATFQNFDERLRTICFCRSYDVNAPACNEYPKMISSATKLLMQEENGREPRQLIRHFLNIAGKLWCQSGPFHATIFMEQKTGKFLRNTKCVSKQIEVLKVGRTHTPKVFDNAIFCDALPILADEIGCFDLNWDEKMENSQESNVICCCSHSEQCEKISNQIQRVVFHFQKSITE